MPESDLLAAARRLRPLIEAEANEVEKSLGMTPPIVDAMVESGLFRLLLPESLGGHEADPGTILEVCEEISYADGSVGWSYAQNTSLGGYLAYLDPAVAKPFAKLRTGAGMFAPKGIALKEAGGFRVSGKFQFGTGCGHADYMGGCGMEMHGGEMAPFRDSLPMLRAFIVPRANVEIDGNWDVMGLSGTGSFDYEVPEQFVEEGATFWVFESEPRSGGALYGLSPIPLGTISSVAWALGVAERALSEIVKIVTTEGRTRMGSAPLREQQVFQRALGVHSQALRAGRLLAHEVYGSTVEAIRKGISEAERVALVRDSRAAGSYVVELAKAATSFAYEASGSHGLRNPSLLQRCFRDLYVGASHLVFDERNYDEAVKERLGLQPLPF